MMTAARLRRRLLNADEDITTIEMHPETIAVAAVAAVEVGAAARLKRGRPAEASPARR
jgi:hypothetical protein